MQEKLITIATYVYPNELSIAKARLESEGIKCFIYNENIIGVNPFLSNAVGGAQLKVSISDAEAARKILSQSAELEEEYKDFFKEDQEDIEYKKEEEQKLKQTQKVFKWGCISIIVFFILFFILGLIFSFFKL